MVIFALDFNPWVLYMLPGILLIINRLNGLYGRKLMKYLAIFLSLGLLAGCGLVQPKTGNSSETAGAPADTKQAVAATTFPSSKTSTGEETSVSREINESFAS